MSDLQSRATGQRDKGSACAGMVALLALALSACGGGDDSGASLPAPPEGKATVGGRLSLDGEGLAKEEVELQVGGKTRETAKTDADGQFVLAAVAPGTYTLYTDPVVRQGPTSEARGTKLSCEAPGFNPPGSGTFVLGPATITSNGGTRYSTDWPFEGKSFKVTAGDTVAKDIEVSCEESKG
jgi:hypothetical protein